MSHLDRYGDTLEDSTNTHRCRKGWLTPEDADTPIPCPICKPRRKDGHRATQTPKTRPAA